MCVGGREQKCYSSKPKHASSCPVGFGLLFFIYTGSMGCACTRVKNDASKRKAVMPEIFMPIAIRDIDPDCIWSARVHAAGCPIIYNTFG